MSRGARPYYVGLSLPMLIASAVSAQSPRVFLVPQGMNAASTTPGQQAPVEVIRGQSLGVDVYVETNGGPLGISGVQFSMPCASAGAAAEPVIYLAGSAETSKTGLGGCAVDWFDHPAPGNCPGDAPGGLLAGPLGSVCDLSAGSPVRIGSFTYMVPMTIGAPNAYVLDPANVILTDAAQAPIASVGLDGLTITICETCPPVPALSTWGGLALLLSLMTAGTVVTGRRSGSN